MDTLIKELESKSKSLVESLRQELGAIRTNRPSTQLVEDIQVEYMGARMRVKELASMSVNPPREIVIAPWDKESIPVITKAIQESPLKMNPNVDGVLIRLQLPALSEER